MFLLDDHQQTLFLYPLESANHNYYLRTCALDWEINRNRMLPLVSRLTGSISSHRLFYDLPTEQLVNGRWFRVPP
ncbi:uncharacterized protein ARMOST_07049 [Armillaria ostoyae]|uniref:Uncharacterized protein n=1 Tax=Armillaria ostoyae TaxID=47428 RepID=A0A284R4Q5_ARMOS|nr:uncharacterized protein ARMOST_07049 [Armillaria ostoyae]